MDNVGGAGQPLDVALLCGRHAVSAGDGCQRPRATLSYRHSLPRSCTQVEGWPARPVV